MTTDQRETTSSIDMNSGCQRVSNDYTESQMEPTSRDLLPKYYPRDHEVTRWLVNQMRCRNGLHHFVNLANLQPSLLSAYFELYDQPHLYIDSRTGPGIPAYSIKTVLYLTPLAIAVYFRLRSVLRLLLDTSGTRIHARGRQEIDVNATCYVRRTKPRPGPFILDEYSTTYPAVLAVRREFFAGLSLLMSAGYHPQAPIGIVERLGTASESTLWFVDLLDFCVKLLNVRPGLDVIGLLQAISYRTLSVEVMNPRAFYFDTCVFDAKFGTQGAPGDEVWCSVFHRITKKGASRNYSNCGNRLIGLLEHITAAGFFRQKHMPRGPFHYDKEILSRRGSRLVGAKKMTTEMIDSLQGAEREMAQIHIALDRDMCLCLLTLWVERMRNRCLDRQAQRLFRILTIALYETQLLHDFLNPPDDAGADSGAYPGWLAVGMLRTTNKPHAMTMSIAKTNDFLEEDSNEMCELEAAQVNEIRQEVGLHAHALGLVELPEKLYRTGYSRMIDFTPMVSRAVIGDAESAGRSGLGITARGEGFDATTNQPYLNSIDTGCSTERTSDTRGRTLHSGNAYMYSQRSVNNRQTNNASGLRHSSSQPASKMTPPILAGDGKPSNDDDAVSKSNEQTQATSFPDDFHGGRLKPESAAAGEPNVLSPELVVEKSVGCSLGKTSEVKLAANRRTLVKRSETERSGCRAVSDNPVSRETKANRAKRIEPLKGKRL